MPVIKIAFWQKKTIKRLDNTFATKLLPKIQVHTNISQSVYVYNTFDTITTNGDRLRFSFLEAF